MNFLFTSVLVLLIVAPGLAFFRAYYSDRFSIRYSRLTVTDQVFRSIVPAVTVQAIAIFVVDAIFKSHVVRLDVLGIMLTGAKDDATLLASFEVVQGSLGQLVGYHLFMIAVGAIAGWQCRRLVRNLKWDRRFTWLRFDNKWFYLLSGEVVEFAEGEAVTDFSDAALIDYVMVDVLVKVEEGNILYTGIVVDYELENDGGLKSLQIKGAKRKGVAQSESKAPSDTEKTSTHDIRGNVLVIPNSQIINLNITYWIEDTDSDSSDDSQQISIE